VRPRARLPDQNNPTKKLRLLYSVAMDQEFREKDEGVRMKDESELGISAVR